MPASLFHTLNISRQDILSHMLDLDVTSSNLANVNTAGYKTTRSNFQEMLNAQLKEGTQMRATQALTMQVHCELPPVHWIGPFKVTVISA